MAKHAERNVPYSGPGYSAARRSVDRAGSSGSAVRTHRPDRPASAAQGRSEADDDCGRSRGRRPLPQGLQGKRQARWRGSQGLSARTDLGITVL